MRRRVLTTTKILAVALVATPACTKPDIHAEPAPSAFATAAASATTDAHVEDTKLVALRAELDAMKRDDALAKVDHFRPLCDEAGYPLVGNLARKVAEPSLQPSEVCAEVRKKKGR